MWQCPKCGANNSNNYSFCGNCGYGRTEKKAGVSKNTLLGIAAAVIILVLGIWVIRLTQETKSVAVGAAPSYTAPSSASESGAHTHTWGNWVVEVQPGCESPGVEVRFCLEDANHQERREIPALGHDWQPATSSRPKTCSRCGATMGSALPVEKTPSVEDVDRFGNEIEHPKSSAYLPTYETMYVKPQNGYSIYVYFRAQAGQSNRRKYVLYEDDEVTVIARQSKFSCVIFTTKEGEEHIGWVGSNLLSYEK